jgi:hypothetical protein
VNALSDVAGIDVGLTFVKPTSGVCRTGDSGDVVRHTYIDRVSRTAALGGELIYSVLAIDAPVLPEGKLDYSPRPCEKLFIWGAFQKRCKPGETHVSGTSQALRRSGVETAHALAATVAKEDFDRPFPRVFCGRNIVEAFPNAFLGVSLEESAFGSSTARGQKFDWLFDQWLRQGLPEKLRAILCWTREEFWRSVCGNRHHDERAALICALTSICVLRGFYVAVGEPVSGYFFLPSWETWASWARATIDRNRTDNRLTRPVDVWIDGTRYGKGDKLPGLKPLSSRGN